MNQLSLFLAPLLVGISGAAHVTSYPEGQTVTYNPGEGCMPYDGSTVPDCSEFVNPDTKWPFYHEHSSNCSRFWECGPVVETCLFECAGCQSEIGADSACNDQWALTFDPSYQYPEGPICNWPFTIECNNGKRCTVGDDTSCNHNDLCGECVAPGYCEYHPCCQEDDDCSLNACGTCVVNDGGLYTCVYPDCCTSDDCTEGCNGVCNVDGECDYDGCCDNSDCTEDCNGQCGTDGECTYPGECCSDADCGDCGVCGEDFTCSIPDCCSNSDCTEHCDGECGADGSCSYPECCEDSDCEHVDGVCNVPAPHDGDFCDYCNNGNCEPGCAHDGLGSSNCPATHPTCYGHVCGCTENAECDNYDGECDMTDSSPYEGHCYYCDGEKAQCVPGCGGMGLDNNHNCPADYECNLDTHQCEETICTEDEMCEGFNQVCNDAHDNCFYCGGCEGLGCCPGCHDTALNCKPGDVCNMDSHLCENPNLCETDEDCNQDVSGVCDTGNAIYTECFFCNMGANGNTCEPGCKYDGPTDAVPSCPAAPTPICNEENHRCEAAPGHQLLTYIKVTSSGCDGCDEEGLSMKLVGDDEVVPIPECETVGLDHPGKVDYASVGEFRAVEEERPMGWGSCYESPLDGKVSSATVTWTGTGTWRGNSICFDWNASRKVYICTLPAGSSLANGESAELSCETGDGVDCP
eukprot:TRINITY_DN6687_c0_g1_i1.p1 TRINITY_DN6687_c0_g1~~TRINITY_DN6687_c0_g1_i1.p1  ORF type:complete len:690 (-),score=119.86 TRINITY_DN6687_c0_g1_i1:89-2158(-)